jgi:catechol 2,3-dioxygenase-like lactoylglutathione lyase family enzyme
MEARMKLEFLVTPTTDLQASLALYRDQLGWEEAWREGEATVALRIPGSDVQLMLQLVDDLQAPGSRPGPLFVVDSVERFAAGRPAGLAPLTEVEEIPGGYMATFADPAGNAVHVLDQSTDAG